MIPSCDGASIEENIKSAYLFYAQHIPTGGTHASVNNRSRSSSNRSYDLGGPGFGRLPRWRPEEAEWPVLEGVKGI
jgi:hypothetical protein